jgi:hypothetical protein
MKKDKSTTFGREYLLESLPVEWDEKLDGPRKKPKGKKEKGDVVVSSSEMQLLKNLGLIK